MRRTRSHIEEYLNMKSRLALPHEPEPKIALIQELAKSDPDPKEIARSSDVLLDKVNDSVRFTVDAQHINRLWLELVGKQETALSEFIKNAYDADATSVDIDFENFDKVGENLEITDNGSGINFQTVRNSWMRLSTNDKGENPVSARFKRLQPGERVLAELRFNDWDEDFTAGTNLNQIWHELVTYAKDYSSSGTTLKIRNPQDRWTTATIGRVWKSVLFFAAAVLYRRSAR